MDLKPTPPRGPAPQAPLVDPVPPVTEDPFKPDVPPAPGPGPKVAKVKKSHKGLKVFLIIVVLLALMGGGGYGIFYWQHQHVDRLIAQRGELNKEIADLNAHMAEMEAENAKLTKEVPVALTADELVIKTVTADCQANLDPTTKKALVYTAGTGQKKVLYSSDKSFALTYGFCEKTTHDPAQQKGVPGIYLKNVGGTWVILTTSMPLTAQETALYGIPTKFE